MSRVRWVICGLLFFATTINYIDRQILALIKELLDKELGWTNEQIIEATRGQTVATMFRDAVTGHGDQVAGTRTRASPGPARLDLSEQAQRHPLLAGHGREVAARDDGTVTRECHDDAALSRDEIVDRVVGTRPERHERQARLRAR